jgi:putative FmdB family regulatory protein
VPLYEYLCPKCGRFEVIRKFSDPPLKKCPTCGRKLEKLLSAPAIQFKGAGWYVTDYAKKSGASEGSSKSSASADSPAGKNDATPAATAAAEPAKTGKTKDKPAKKSG